MFYLIKCKCCTYNTSHTHACTLYYKTDNNSTNYAARVACCQPKNLNTYDPNCIPEFGWIIWYSTNNIALLCGTLQKSTSVHSIWLNLNFGWSCCCCLCWWWFRWKLQYRRGKVKQNVNLSSDDMMVKTIHLMVFICCLCSCCCHHHHRRRHCCRRLRNWENLRSSLE